MADNGVRIARDITRCYCVRIIDFNEIARIGQSISRGVHVRDPAEDRDETSLPTRFCLVENRSQLRAGRRHFDPKCGRYLLEAIATCKLLGQSCLGPRQSKQTLQGYGRRQRYIEEIGVARAMRPDLYLDRRGNSFIAGGRRP